jgi:hypothetical protein
MKVGIGFGRLLSRSMVVVALLLSQFIAGCGGGGGGGDTGGGLSSVDLLAIDFSCVETSAQAGGSITVTDTVTNVGVEAVGQFDVGLYLSTDSVISITDTLIASRTVSSLGESIPIRR